jgi:hypothetical protein
MEGIRPTQVEELRKPHPNQISIDAAGAALLRVTAPEVLQPAPEGKDASRPSLWGAPSAEEQTTSPR